MQNRHCLSLLLLATPMAIGRRVDSHLTARETCSVQRWVEGLAHHAQMDVELFTRFHRSTTTSLCDNW